MIPNIAITISGCEIHYTIQYIVFLISEQRISAGMINLYADSFFFLYDSLFFTRCIPYFFRQNQTICLVIMIYEKESCGLWIYFHRYL